MTAPYLVLSLVSFIGGYPHRKCLGYRLACSSGWLSRVPIRTCAHLADAWLLRSRAWLRTGKACCSSRFRPHRFRRLSATLLSASGTLCTGLQSISCGSRSPPRVEECAEKRLVRLVQVRVLPSALSVF